MSLVFVFFSNISETIFGSDHVWFCREFQALSFDNQKSFNHRDTEEEILKILRGSFFLGHPLQSQLSKEIFHEKYYLFFLIFY